MKSKTWPARSRKDRPKTLRHDWKLSSRAPRSGSTRRSPTCTRSESACALSETGLDSPPRGRAQAARMRSIGKYGTVARIVVGLAFLELGVVGLPPIGGLI